MITLTHPEPATMGGLIGTLVKRLAGLPPAKPKRGGVHVTGRPIHRNSMATGSVAEAEFAKPLSDRLRSDIYSLACDTLTRSRELRIEDRKGERLMSADERRIMSYTTADHEVLIRLLDEEKYRKGWVFPSYENIMEWTSRSRSTVARALRKLKELGFLEWLRRYIYTRDKELGARSEQTSNLYRFQMPSWLKAVVSKRQPAPLPDDEVQRQQQRSEEHMVMVASLTDRQIAQTVQDPEARAALLRMALEFERREAAELKARECHSETEPHPESINKDLKSCPSRATRRV